MSEIIDISSSRLKKIAIHQVGNKTREEGIELSKYETSFDSDLEDILLKNYLKTFSKQEKIYDFFHESDLNLNAIFTLSSRIFSNHESFIKQTQNISKYLYSTSNHPNISEGNVLFLLFSNILYKERIHDALAIIKIEKKDDFLDIQKSTNSFNLIERSGISLSQIQKGSLIISENAGVFSIDNLGQKIKYWLDSFLKVSLRQTSQSNAKACGSVLKGVMSKIDNADKEAKLITKLKTKTESGKILNFSEVKEILSEFVNDDIISKSIAGANISSGINLSNESIFYSTDFVKQTKNITSKIKVSSGASFVITDPSLMVSKVKIEPHENGYRAIIDVNIKKDQ